MKQCLIDLYSLVCQLCASLSFSSKLSSLCQAMIWQFKFDQLIDYILKNSLTTHMFKVPPHTINFDDNIN